MNKKFFDNLKEYSFSNVTNVMELCLHCVHWQYINISTIAAAIIISANTTKIYRNDSYLLTNCFGAAHLPPGPQHILGQTGAHDC